MSSLRESFEDVADWCERHLEERHGREVGMEFGAVMRIYRQLAGKTGPHSDHEIAECRQLDERADSVLLDFCTRFMIAYGFREDRSTRLAQPASQITSMTHDPGP